VFENSNQALSAGWSYESTWADLDSDGDPDLVTANSNTADQIWWNDGTGWLTQWMNVPQQRYSTSVVAGDFDGDGMIDLFFARYGAADVVWWNRPEIATEGR
jgi:hypothetical protein